MTWWGWLLVGLAVLVGLVLLAGGLVAYDFYKRSQM